MPQLSDINPFAKFNIGVGAIGNALILLAIITVIFSLIGWLIYWRINSRRYNKRIPLFRLVGNVPTRVGIYLARDFPIGKAGDKLWFVKGIKKYLPPATIQSAPNEFWHWEREDGEWINFSMNDLDAEQKKAGIRYIHQDMRSQRIATNNILEQRLIHKGFWEKYKDMIVHLIFYVIVTMLIIVIFWQWSNMIDKTAGLMGSIDNIAQKVTGLECVEKVDQLIPALFLPFIRFWRRK